MSTEISDELIKEIELFIQYAVPEEDLTKAKELVIKHSHDRIVLQLLREHYSQLPGDKEEAVNSVLPIAHKQGVYIFVVSSDSLSSMYLVSIDKIVWLGEYGKEVNKEILDYFEYKSQKQFLLDCKPIESLARSRKAGITAKTKCSVCGVIEGEMHLLGCVVEVCPWCSGQLNACNCRFDQLKTEEIEDDEQLEEFYDLLSAKGRIPFVKDQAPAYPGTSDGLDIQDKTE